MKNITEVIMAEKEKMDEIVMKLLHYFITEKEYNPIILHGAKNEIWLENFTSEFGIVRIVTDYIHNDEQMNFDIFKTKRIAAKIGRKTFAFHIHILSLYLNLGDNVHMEKFENVNQMECISLNEMEDLKENEVIKNNLPDILDNMDFKEDGFELFMKLTADIASKNEDNNAKAEDVFKPKVPVVTYSLMGINILLFLAMYFWGNGSEDALTLLKFGANYAPLVKMGEYYRLITAGFLHIGIFHLFFNMYALYIVGSQLEGFIGKTKFIIIYFGSMITGNLMGSLFLGNSISAGASGAIFGLFGALLYFGYHYRVYLGNMMTSQIIPVLILNFLLGFMIKGIDLASHIGGFIGGLLLLWALGVTYKSKKNDKIQGWILFMMFFLFLLFLALR